MSDRGKQKHQGYSSRLYQPYRYGRFFRLRNVAAFMAAMTPRRDVRPGGVAVYEVEKIPEVRSERVPAIEQIIHHEQTRMPRACALILEYFKAATYHNTQGGKRANSGHFKKPE